MQPARVVQDFGKTEAIVLGDRQVEVPHSIQGFVPDGHYHILFDPIPPVSKDSRFVNLSDEFAFRISNDPRFFT